MKRASASVVALGLALAGFVVPASATPGDDATLVAAPFTVTSGTFASSTSASVGCPAGSRIVGGGSGPGTPPPDPSYLSLRVSSPLGQAGTPAGTNDGDIASTWTAAITNVNPAPGMLAAERVFANCSATSDAKIEASTDSIPTANTTKSTLTTCPTGSRAVGGGVASIGSQAAFIIRESGPVDETGLIGETFTNEIARGWRATVRSSIASVSYSVFALCSQGSDAKLYVNSFSAPATSESSLTENCPANRRALGGGVGASTPAGTYVLSSAPVAAGKTTAQTSSGETARGWFASVFNSSPTEERYLVFALCASDPGFADPPPGPGPGPGPDPTPGGDTTPPGTKFLKHPAKKTTAAKAAFRFSSTEPGGAFECKLDKGAFKPCVSPLKKAVKRGRKHRLAVVAIDAAGNRDATPAVFSWTVKPKTTRR